MSTARPQVLFALGQNDKTIDGDMILAGQAVTFGVDSFVIATTNVGHLTRFVAADLWTNL